MKPNPDSLRNCRDFLSHLLDLPPKEAIDLLTNHGEQQVAIFNEALGTEAFKKGDSVIASPEGHEEFMGTICDIRADEKGVLFSVRDQDDDVFDCEAGELVPNQE